jgi:hypothetical protein
MLNENAKKWVAALRSGRFSQGVSSLCCDDNHCCLGVAFRVYAEENEHVPFTEIKLNNRCALQKRDFVSVSSVFKQGTEETDVVLLPSVRDWLGLRTANGSYNDPNLAKDENEYNFSLTRKNDTGASFSKIADIIESEPKGLFKE